VAAALSGFYLRVISYRFLPAYGAFFAALIRDLGFLGRTDIISVTLVYLTAAYLGQRFFLRIHCISFKELRIIVPALILVLVLINLIGDFLGKSEKEAYFAVKREILGYPLPSSVLSYQNRLVAPLVALDEAIRDDSGMRLWGVATFYPFSRVLNRLILVIGALVGEHDIEGLPVVDYTYDFRLVPTAANTFTYLRYFYEDFGLLGILISPYLLGLITSSLWLGLHFSYSFVRLVTLTFLYNAVFYSFAEWRLWNIYFLFAMLIASILGRMADKRKEQAQHSVKTFH
jgi:oligosaccharide repeat unit polymerase